MIGSYTEFRTPFFIGSTRHLHARFSGNIHIHTSLHPASHTNRRMLYTKFIIPIFTPTLTCPMLRISRLACWANAYSTCKPKLLIVFGLPLAPVHSRGVCVSTCGESDCGNRTPVKQTPALHCGKQNRPRHCHWYCSHPAVTRRPGYHELQLMLRHTCE